MRKSFTCKFWFAVCLCLAYYAYLKYDEFSNCDIKTESAYVNTPTGRNIQKYNHTVDMESYGNLIKDCNSNNEKCLDVREYGETMMRRSQLSVMRMLYIIEIICAKHNIEYWLLGSTLLGAQRDQAFIPRDDGGNIGMLDTDYNKFIEIVKEELPSDLLFQEKPNDIYNKNKNQICIAKLRDKNTCYGYCVRHNCKFEDGIQINIYSFEKRNDFEASKVITDTTDRYHFHINDILPTAYVPFEGVLFKAPRNPDNVLTQIYGEGFAKKPSKQCPDHGFISIPWYSCDYISNLNSKDKDKIIETSLTHSSFIYWYFR